MELVVRCSLADQPGSLARLAAAVGEVGVDIEAVEVVDVLEGRAIDDMVVVVDGPARGQELLDHLGSLDDVEVIHSGPSRGHPGDAVARAAVSLQAMLERSVDVESGTRTLIGGLLRADHAEIVDEPPSSRPTRLVVALTDRWLVLTRSYPFTPTEHHRAEALSRVAAATEATRPDSSMRGG